MFEVNMCEETDDLLDYTSLYGLLAFVNHDKNPNIRRQVIGHNFHIIYAAYDIKAGGEILNDYI